MWGKFDKEIKITKNRSPKHKEYNNLTEKLIRSFEKQCGSSR
jgi:predicted RNA-binding protein with PUA domain